MVFGINTTRDISKISKLRITILKYQYSIHAKSHYKSFCYLHEFEVLGSKLQIFHDSTVSQFPEETY